MSEVSPRDPYEVLGVDVEASTEEVRDAYRKLAQTLHPDKRPADKSEQDATREFQELTEAYQTLTDPTRRARFDDTGTAEETKDSELLNTAIEKLAQMLSAFVQEDPAEDADLLRALQLQTQHVVKRNTASIDEGRMLIRKRQALAKKWRHKRGGRNIFQNMIRRDIAAIKVQMKDAERTIEVARECLRILEDYEYGERTAALTRSRLIRG